MLSRYLAYIIIALLPNLTTAAVYTINPPYTPVPWPAPQPTKLAFNVSVDTGPTGNMNYSVDNRYTPASLVNLGSQWLGVQLEPRQNTEIHLPTNARIDKLVCTSTNYATGAQSTIYPAPIFTLVDPNKNWVTSGPIPSGGGTDAVPEKGTVNVMIPVPAYNASHTGATSLSCLQTLSYYTDPLDTQPTTSEITVTGDIYWLPDAHTDVLYNPDVVVPDVNGQWNSELRITTNSRSRTRLTFTGTYTDPITLTDATGHTLTITKGTTVFLAPSTDKSIAGLDVETRLTISGTTTTTGQHTVVAFLWVVYL